MYFVLCDIHQRKLLQHCIKTEIALNQSYLLSSEKKQWQTATQHLVNDMSVIPRCL